MKQALTAILLITASTGASLAEESDTAPSLIERGAQLLLEGFLQELEPALEGMEELGPKFKGFAAEMGPALVELLDRVQDWSLYHPPEILPNGDIIIRKKERIEDDNGAIDL